MLDQEKLQETCQMWRDAYRRVLKELDAWQQWAVTTECLPRPIYEKRLFALSDVVKQLVIAVRLLEDVNGVFYRKEIAEMNAAIEKAMNND